MSRVDVLGVGFDPVGLDEAVARVCALIAAGPAHLVITANVELVMRSRRDDGLRGALAGADLIVADGVGVVWGARQLRRPLPGRVPGIVLADRVCAEAARRGWRVYLLGARPGVAEQAAVRLQAAHPGLAVAGCRDGYFTPAEEPDVIRSIREAAPAIVLAGLGSPRQERWLTRHLAALAVPVAIGVGGSFDVWAGYAHRAPLLMQTLGLEWLYRLACEPRRLRRQLAIPHFMAVVFATQLRRVPGATRKPPSGP